MKVTIKLVYDDPQKKPVVGTIELDRVIDATVVSWHGTYFRYVNTKLTLSREAIYTFREENGSSWVNITDTLEVKS